MQKRWHSLLEAGLGTAIGFGIAYVITLLVLPLFDLPVTASSGFWITAIFTVISVIRSYWIRRLFNHLHIKRIL